MRFESLPLRHIPQLYPHLKTEQPQAELTTVK